MRRLPRRLVALWCYLAWLAATAGAQEAEPRLSADSPITFDAASKTLVASGNAEFSNDEVLVQAEEIRYFQEEKRLRAEGNVRVTREGFRVLSEWITYDMTTRTFASGRFRAGRPPVFIEGESFSGSLDEIQVRNAFVYYGEPNPFSPRVKVSTATIYLEQRMLGDDVVLLLGPLSVPLPNLNQAFGSAEAVIELEPGYRSSLGLFNRAHILLPVAENWLAGANFDFYTKRGVLVGPAARYHKEGDWFVHGDLSTGFIYDAGQERADDVLGRSIDEQRYFANLGSIVASDDSRVALSTSILSDSEVERDFRPDYFEDHPEPDSYLEASHQLGGGLALSGMVRYTPNNFYELTERLPEIRLDQAPRLIPGTGAYISGFTSVARYRALDWVAREAGSDPDTDLPFVDRAEALNRWDSLVGLQRPVTIASWLTITPRAAGRYVFLDGTVEGESSASAAPPVVVPGLPARDLPVALRVRAHDQHRVHGELGVDAVATFTGEWDLRNATWRIDGLRHVLRPVARYRWQPGEKARAFSGLRVLDQRLYQPTLPIIDLEQIRWVDDLVDRSLVRLGVENLVQTPREGEVTNLLELNLYRDFVADDVSYGFTGGMEAPRGVDEDAYYLQVVAEPARWLRLAVEQKMRSEDLRTEETRMSATLRSGDKWRLRFRVDLFEDLIEQYALDGTYRFAEGWWLLGDARYDARGDFFSRQTYGVRQRLGNTWLIDYFVSISDGSAREDEWRLGIKLDLVSF